METVQIQAFVRIIPEDTRKRFADKILRLKQGPDQASRQQLNRIINKHIRIPGFRNSSRSPEPQLLRTMISPSSNPVSLFPFLHFWVNQMEDLLDFFTTEYRNQLRKLHKSLSEHWSPDEIDSILDSVQPQFPDYDHEDILLVSHWVSRFHERIAKDKGETAVAMDEKSELVEFDFDSWLRKLQHLPAESDQWEQVETFIARAEAICNGKSEERQEQFRRYEKIITDFLYKYKRELEYFDGYSVLPSDLNAIKMLPSEDLLGLIHKLAPLFDKHQTLLAETPRSVDEEIQNLTQKRTLISEIQSLFCQFQGAISDIDSTPPERATESPLQVVSSEPEIKAEPEPDTTVDDDTPSGEVLPASLPTTSPLKSRTETHFQPEVREEEPDLQSILDLVQQTDSASEIARSADALDSPLVISAINCRLLLEGETELAFHVSRGIEDTWPDFSFALPSRLLRTVILGPHITSSQRAIAQRLSNDFAEFPERWFRGGPTDWNHTLGLLAIAAALKPSLMAPQTGASTILHGVHLPGLEHLYELVEEVAKYGDLNLPFNPYSLRHAKDQASWAAEVKSLQDESRAWRDQVSSTRLTYGPATRVWKQWIGPKGDIGTLLDDIINNRQDQLPLVREQIFHYQNKQFVDKHLQSTNRRLRNTSAKKRIEGAALSQIFDRIDRTLEFGRRWCHLIESRPGKTTDFLQSRVTLLRNTIEQKMPQVKDDLESYKGTHKNPLVIGAVEVCQKSVSQLWSLFDPDASPLPSEAPAPMLVNADLLRIRSLENSLDWQPKNSDASAILALILESLKEGILDWSKAFDLRFELRDHIGTGQIISYLDSLPDSDLDLMKMKERRHTDISRCRTDLVRDVENTRKEIQKGIALDLLAEKNGADLTATVDRICLLADGEDENVEFQSLRAQLRDARAEITRARKLQVSRVHERLKSMQLEENDRKRIKACLEQGNALTANEYIHMLQRSEHLPIRDTEAPRFQSYFPETWSALNKYCEKRTSPEIIAQVRAQNNKGPLKLSEVPGAQIKSAVSLLENWHKAKRKRRIDRQEALAILTALGFTVENTFIEQDRDRRHLLIQFTTPVIHDRDTCPIPIFGSQAKGRYSVLCVWDRPTEAEIVIAASREFLHGAKLVFHFGRMTKQRRRDFARLCIQKRKTLAVVDDILVTYLCGERGLRLPVMFDCSLPFTFAEPHTTTAGLVPPEMFYGRDREQDNIIDPMGSCFIYGGRQLGKTALLRSVERRFHKLERNRVAKWLDLKVERIGYDRPLSDIWKLIIRELKSVGVLGRKTPWNLRTEKLLRLIEEWIAKDTRRKILLLLDEADTFLEKDGKEGFIQTVALKGLMDRTDRRFKVVLAGLHNVQRTTRQANNPLAHYGEPICIGPLETNEARRLVEKPFSTLGYEFESPELVFRILAQTNYYPSLIQLYCKILLRYLTDPHRMIFDPRTAPPYKISARHVDHVYDSKELRDEIRRRFNLTLELDSRYQIIAYAIALESLGPDSSGLVEGFNVSQVRDEALVWWHEGFTNSHSEEAIRALLDEMVGLGVLRIVSPGKYALRSSNILSLLGNQKEIEAELEKERESPLDFDPASYRTPLSATDHNHRSILTVRQEGDLQTANNEISLLFGTPAAGIECVSPSLQNCFTEVIEFDPVFDKVQFEGQLRKKIRRLGESRTKDTTLILVPGNCPWSERWVAAARNALNRRGDKDSFLGVLFVADPQTTWRIVDKNTEVSSNIATLNLRPWDDTALRQWFSDCGFGPRDRAGRDQIRKTIGSWPLLLDDFYKRCHDTTEVSWKTILGEMAEDLKRDTRRSELLEQLGCFRPEIRAILGTLAMSGGWTIDELIDLHPDLAPDTVRHVVQWAYQLNLVRPSGPEGWETEPFATQLVGFSTGAPK